MEISDQSGASIIKIIDNQIKYSDQLNYDRIAGKFVATLPVTVGFLPQWAINQMKEHERSFASDGNLRILAIEVIGDGIVRIEGIWHINEYEYLIISRERFALISRKRAEPLSMQGAGLDTVLRYQGPITQSLFKFN